MTKATILLAMFFLVVLPIDAQQADFPKLTGPYLGQKPPGLTAETFAPGIISTEGSNEFCASFSPDGRGFYFNRGMTIMVCRQKNDGWTAPKPASFNENHRGHEAHLAFDNTRMFFGGSRPPQPYGIWLTERTSGGWSEPRRLWDGMYLTSAKNGNVYFGAEFPPPAHIVMTRLTDTGYIGPGKQEIRLADSRPEQPSIFHPAIAPDESYILFDDNKGLYVSFREADGSWADALSLNKLLKEETATIPAVSPDGKYLFYSSRGNLHWVSTKILERLKPRMEATDASATIRGDPMKKPEINENVVLTILYDNRSLNSAIAADHGFSCLLESGDRSCLFDAGRVSDTFMANAAKLGVDYSKIEQVFISHIHDDHMGGLFAVLARCNKPALFLPFSYPRQRGEPLGEQADRDFMSLVDRLKPLVSGIVQRKEGGKVGDRYYSTGIIDDQSYEQALIVPTSKGLIVITGCAHPGILEIVGRAKELMKQDVYLVLGGFHLVSSNSAESTNIAHALRKLTKFVGPCHCTGERAQQIFRDVFGEDYIDVRAGLKLTLGEGKLK